MTRRWWVLAALVLSVLVVGFDATILNVALPTMATALHAGTGDLQWIVDSYIVVFAVLLLPAGLIGDRYGRKRVLLAGLALFGVASLAAAYAGSTTGLTVARAVMGIGAATVLPLSMSVLPAVFPEGERAKAIAVWSAGFALALPLGPILGGYLLDRFWWGAIFLINVPIVVIAVIAAGLLVPESRDSAAGRVDVGGALLSVVGLGTLVYGVIRAPDLGWTAPGTLALFALAAAGLTGFVLRERRAADPMLDLGLFADRNFLWGSLAVTFAGFGLMGVLFVLPQYLQADLGYDALAVGVRLVPIMAGLLVAGLASERLTRLVGPRVTITTGMVVLAVGMTLGARTTVGDGYAYTAWWLAVLGVGVGTALVPATDVVLATLPPARTGVGSGAVQSMRQVGGALGVAVLGSLLSSVYVHRLDTGRLPAAAAHAARDSVAGAAALGDPAVLDSARHAFVAGMDAVLGTAALLCLLGAVATAVFLPGRRAAGPAPAESDHELSRAT